MKTKLDSSYALINVLKYSIKDAQTAEVLFNRFPGEKSIQNFKRKLRKFAHEARLNGHLVIGDDNGYYLAMNRDEWKIYQIRRFSGIKDELKALAACEKITVADLIKNVYAVSVTDNNYELNLEA